VLNNATLTIPSLAIDGGVLTGNGTIAGNLTNNGGIIQPGGVDTIGTINVTGNFSQNTGSIEIEIKSATPVAAAGEYDKLTISGSGDFIGGSIDLLAVASYGKKSGDRFEPISYGSLPASTTIVNPIGSEILTVSFNPTILNIDIASIGIISWTGLGDGVSWGDLANWSDNITPSIFDDVSIAGGFDISITGGANAGTLALAATSSLTLTGGTFTLASDSTLAGSFTVSGGTFASNGVTTLNGGFNWNGGTITSPGSGQLITNDVTTISTAVHNLNNISWNNNGTVNWNGGNMMLSGATINNQNASTWNIQTASNNDISGAGSFNMLTGSVLNVDSGTTIINSVFTNNSSVNINGGTLTLAEAGNPTDTGAYVISSGALQLDSDRQFTGALNMNGGTLRINANNSFADGVTVKAGTLDVGTSGVLDVSSVATGLVIEANGAARVNGNVTGSVANNGVLSGSGIIVGDVTNAGQFNPGDQIGTFTIDGDLTLLKASQLNIDIAGLEKGTEYDELIVNGAVKFNGNLNIKVDNSTGYNAAVQDSFYPVSYASSSGDVVLNAPPAYAFDLGFETKNLNLVTTIVPGLFIPDTQNEVIVLMDILKNIESIKDKEKEKEDLLHSEENEKGHALMCS